MVHSERKADLHKQLQAYELIRTEDAIVHHISIPLRPHHHVPQRHLDSILLQILSMGQ